GLFAWQPACEMSRLTSALAKGTQPFRLLYGFVMPTALSNSAENLTSSFVILGGCSPNVVHMRAAISGLSLINSVAATMSERLLFMSCRIGDSLRFNCSTSWTLNVTGSVGKPMRRRMKAGNTDCKLLSD